MENDKEISWRDYSSAGDGTWNEHTGVLLESMLPEGEKLTLGKKYREELKVRNTGTINQYVRVNIYKYWLDANGVKMRDLSPDLIDLNLVNLGTDWIEDEGARTKDSAWTGSDMARAVRQDSSPVQIFLFFMRSTPLFHQARSVVFNAEKQMVSSFSTADINDVVGGMQPGDNVIVTSSVSSTVVPFSPPTVSLSNRVCTAPV